jgi:hypothetical protein
MHRDFGRIPGAEVHETPDLLWYTVPSVNSWLNGASRCSLDPAAADCMLVANRLPPGGQTTGLGDPGWQLALDVGGRCGLARRLDETAARVGVDDLDGRHYTPERITDLFINGWYFHSDDEEKVADLVRLTTGAEPISRHVFFDYLLEATRQATYGAVVRLALANDLIDDDPKSQAA